MSIRLEFFADGYENTDVLLLYGGSVEDVQSLREALGSLTNRPSMVRIHELPFVDSIDGCALTAVVSNDVIGVQRVAIDRPIFEWAAPADVWGDTTERLEPFVIEAPFDSTHFQYLNQSEGPQVIYSTHRAW